MLRVAFTLYLLALLALPVKWLRPFGHPEALLADVLFAGACGAWLIDAAWRRRRPRLRPVHLAGLAFLACVLLSALVCADRGRAFLHLLIAIELAAIAVLTSDFAADRRRRAAITRAVALVVAIVVVQATFALGRFYLHGTLTDMVQPNSLYLRRSHWYVRLSAGFSSGPLLGSFCIFSWAVIASGRRALPSWATRVALLAVPVLCLATLSRAVIGLAVTVGIAAAGRGDRETLRRRTGAIVATGALAMAFLSLAPQWMNPLRPPGLTGKANPRFVLLASAAGTLVHHPWLGAGPGALAAEFKGLPMRAHATPLNVAVTTGIPSLAALVILILMLWRRRARPTDLLLWAGLAGVAIDALGLDAEHFRHVWILLGLLDAHSQAVRA